MKEKISELESHSDEILGELAELRNNYEILKEENEELKNDLATCEAENEKLKTDLATCEAENEKLKTDLSTCEANGEKNANSYSVLNEKYNISVNALADQISENKNTEILDALNECAESEAVLSANNEMLTEQIKKLEADIGELKCSYERLKELNSETDNDLKLSRIDTATLRNEIEMMTLDAEKMSSYISTTSNNSETLSKVKEFNIMGKLSSSAQDLFDLNDLTDDIRDAYVIGNITEAKFKSSLNNAERKRSEIKSTFISYGTMYENLF